jgi:hypothetical protein
MVDPTKSSHRIRSRVIHRWIALERWRELAMKRRARFLAVVSFALLTLGLVVFQAGAAMAQNATLSIECGPNDNEVTITNEGPGKADNVQPLETHSGSGQDAGVDLKEDESATFDVPGDGTYTAHGHHGNNEINPELTGNSVTCSFAGSGGLASTGFNPLPYAAAAVLLLGLGGSMVRATRRRRI